MPPRTSSASICRARHGACDGIRIASFLVALAGAILAAILGKPAHAQRAREAANDVPRLAEKLDLRDFTVGGAPAEALLVVHYARPGGDYAGWNLWTWPEGGEGASARFGGEDAFGRYAIVPFAPAPARAGFLVRRGNWEEKDFDQDRFVRLEKGRVTEIWVRSGDDAVLDDPARVDTSVRVAGAFLDGADRITLALTAPWKDPSPRDLSIDLARPGATAPRATSIRALGTSGGRALYEIVLARPIDDSDVARLRLDWSAGPLADAAPVTVFARDVLDGDAFVAADARLGAFVAARETGDAASSTTPSTTSFTTTFTTWSPVADAVDLLLDADRARGTHERVIPLARGAKGLWTATVAEDLHGVAYRYRFTSYGEARTAPDAHGFSAIADSSRTVVVDLARLEPDGFRTVPEPRLAQPTDEILYEIHVRDFSMRDPRAPDELRGTYLGLVDLHTGPIPRNAPRDDPDAPPAAAAESPAASMPSTGLAHLKDLGITAVHLLPVHDFTAKVGEYNWGYWTTLYNVPESNYATDPTDPFSAIRDLRTAVTRLHAHGIRIVLDVVYNHTSDAGPSSPFGAAVPHYFFRTTRDGRLANDSGTGNAFADERPMARKFILDSLEHWLRAYRVDGFRFDLLGCHRPETVRAICERVRAIRPDATLYGEPWTGGGPVHFGKGAQKGLSIAVFNDHLRDAIRGDLDGATPGFATGEGGDVDAIRRGVAGAIDDFAAEPAETINYASAHDNLILWDKIATTQPAASDAVRRAMQKLALGVVLTSQGIPFLHGGCEFGRTKQGSRNSYDAGDGINDFGWSRKDGYRDVFEFTRGLVALRRAHPAFRMSDDAEVRRALSFLNTPRAVAFTLDGRVAGDAWDRILVAYNDEPEPLELELPAGQWTVVVDATRAGTAPLATLRGRTTLPPYSMLVAHAPRR